ncbi:Astra associated protein 1 Asa1 [Coemansia interrupta]|uniref:ASTRA-associated protein 1 n=1 Tax=Coemansia interrupta TaxID=1126814 RepID=A0A9W8LI92_9FUNG|nr:Astra associated protein 1 Asa1 [Coemansia interrupta]
MLQPDFVFRGHQAAVNSVRFFGDDRFLVSGDQDGVLIVWNMLLKRQLAQVKDAHSAAILSVCGVGDSTVITQGRDNKLKVWELDATEFSGSLDLVQSIDVDSINFCKFGYCVSDKTVWITALSDAGSGSAFLYGLENKKKIGFSIGRRTRMKTSADGREDSPMCLKMEAIADRRFKLLVAYESTVLQCFEISVDTSLDTCTAKCTGSVTTDHDEPIMSLDYDTQQHLVYTCAADNKVCCYSVGEKDIIVCAAAPSLLPNAGGSDIRRFYLGAKSLVVVAGWDYCIHLFDGDLLKSICSIPFHRAGLTSVDMSSLGLASESQISNEAVRQRWNSRPRWLVAASRDSRISLWDVAGIIPS